MRVFVALDIPEAVRESLRGLIQRLQPACPGARWVRVEGMHITLKFIGEAPAEQVEHIQAALRGVRSPAAVEMEFRGTGFFPNPRHPRVFWAGIESSANLAAMAAEIEHRMEALGIPRESRAFKPHLTLARMQSEQGLPQLRAMLEEMGPPEFGSARVEELHLVQSTLKRGGAEYKKLATVRFVEQK